LLLFGSGYSAIFWGILLSKTNGNPSSRPGVFSAEPLLFCFLEKALLKRVLVTGLFATTLEASLSEKCEGREDKMQ